MKRYILLLSAFFVLGCSQKAPEINNLKYEQSVTNTKKISLNVEGKPKAQIIITYLNPLQQNVYKNENAFILATYFSDEKFAYDLYADTSTNPTEIKKLKKGDPLIMYLPAYNAWSHYYLVRFPDNKKTHNITLHITSKNYGKSSVNFAKNRLGSTNLF